MPWGPLGGDCAIVERSEGVAGFGGRDCCFLAGAGGESGCSSDGCLVVGEDPDVSSFACCWQNRRAKSAARPIPCSSASYTSIWVPRECVFSDTSWFRLVHVDLLPLYYPA